MIKIFQFNLKCRHTTIYRSMSDYSVCPKPNRSESTHSESKYSRSSHFIFSRLIVNQNERRLLLCVLRLLLLLLAWCFVTHTRSVHAHRTNSYNTKFCIDVIRQSTFDESRKKTRERDREKNLMRDFTLAWSFQFTTNAHTHIQNKQIFNPHDNV